MDQAWWFNTYQNLSKPKSIEEEKIDPTPMPNDDESGLKTDSDFSV